MTGYFFMGIHSSLDTDGRRITDTVTSRRFPTKNVTFTLSHWSQAKIGKAKLGSHYPTCTGNGYLILPDSEGCKSLDVDFGDGKYVDMTLSTEYLKQNKKLRAEILSQKHEPKQITMPSADLVCATIIRNFGNKDDNSEIVECMDHITAKKFAHYFSDRKDWI